MSGETRNPTTREYAPTSGNRATSDNGAAFARPADPRHTGPLRPLAIGAAAVGLITASIGIIAPPAHADTITYPNWNDVQQAKQSVAGQQAMVDQINGLIGDLQTSVDSANIAAEKASESYLFTKVKLDAATQTASLLTSQAGEAAKTAKTSEMRAGLIAARLARSGGNSSASLLLSGGDADHSDSLLYQLGTMSQLTEQSQGIYAQAQKDKNTASALSDQAATAEKQRQTLADAANADLAKAQQAAEAAQSALADQQTKQTQLVAQLATLKSTSVQVETAYLAGQQEKAKEAAAAKAAAAVKPVTPPARPASGGSGGGGSSSSGGSSAGSSGSSGGSSAPAPSGGGSVGAPSRSAVETAIAYAYAQQGSPYAEGGAGPTYFDCSGLTMMAYAAANIYIGGHSVNAQYYNAAANGQLVPFSQRQRGDLIFWGDAPGDLYHVAIYLGNNMIIAARDYGEPLAVQPLWGTPYGLVARPSA